MTTASASDTELKVKQLREILKLTARLINEAKKTEEVVFDFYLINYIRYLSACACIALRYQVSFQ